MQSKVAATHAGPGEIERDVLKRKTNLTHASPQRINKRSTSDQQGHVATGAKRTKGACAWQVRSVRLLPDAHCTGDVINLVAHVMSRGRIAGYLLVSMIPSRHRLASRIAGWRLLRETVFTGTIALPALIACMAHARACSQRGAICTA